MSLTCPSSFIYFFTDYQISFPDDHKTLRLDRPFEIFIFYNFQLFFMVFGINIVCKESKRLCLSMPCRSARRRSSLFILHIRWCGVVSSQIPYAFISVSAFSIHANSCDPYLSTYCLMHEIKNLKDSENINVLPACNDVLGCVKAFYEKAIERKTRFAKVNF